MDIDVWQLPIPDWELLCPNCRYSLRGLPEHRCPECGTKLDMSEIVKTWHQLRDPRFTGHELPFPDFGLQCAKCSHALVGALQYACPGCDAPFDPEGLRPARDWFVIDAEFCHPVPLPVVEAVLGMERVPYMHQRQELLREVLAGPRMVGARLLVHRGFFFEVLWLIRHAELDMEQARERGERDRWACPSCGEENPGNFQVCWNCQASRTANGQERDNT